MCNQEVVVLPNYKQVFDGNVAASADQGQKLVMKKQQAVSAVFILQHKLYMTLERWWFVHSAAAPLYLAFNLSLSSLDFL